MLKLKIILDNGNGIWLVAEEGDYLYAHDYAQHPKDLLADIKSLAKGEVELREFDQNEVVPFILEGFDFDSLGDYLLKEGGKLLATANDNKIYIEDSFLFFDLLG